MVADVQPFTIAQQDNGGLTITFDENLLAGNITTELQVSGDLDAWQAAGPEFVVTRQANHGDGTATKTVTRTAPLPPGPLFLRFAPALD